MISRVRGISLVAVGLGLLLDQLATLIFVDLLEFVLRFLEHGSGIAHAVSAPVPVSSWGFAGLLVVGAGSTVLGGYAAARVAGCLELVHGALVGTGGLLIGAVATPFSALLLPLGYLIPAFLLVLPSAVLGGDLARRARRSPG